MRQALVDAVTDTRLKGAPRKWFAAIWHFLNPPPRRCSICGGRLIQEAYVGRNVIVNDLCERPHPITEIVGYNRIGDRKPTPPPVSEQAEGFSG